ncbi:MAG: hypothetical protein WDX04_15370, partial [Klebsiella michiganensis]
MSENNYGALMMKSALSASDDIDTLLLPGIYFVPVGNVTSPHPDGGVLTIYSGSIVHRSFVSDALMFASSTYNSSSQKWSPWAYPVSRDDLNSSIDGLGGDLVSANEYFSVRHVLSRIRTLEDIGISRPSLGYDPINDKILYKAMQGMDDQELLLAGGIHISKKFRSIRRNNTLLGLRGGLTGTSGAFNDQVMGVSNSLDLAKYGTHDGVSHFMDATLPPLEEWETVAGVVSYSANSVVVDTVTYSDLLSNLLKGDILKTMHSTPCWALVESIDKETGVITVKPWATSAAYVTPSGATGFYANKIDKVWTFNANVIIPENAAGDYAVIGELGAQIKKAGLSYVNGLDVTILPGSIADGTAAYLAR